MKAVVVLNVKGVPLRIDNLRHEEMAGIRSRAVVNPKHLLRSISHTPFIGDSRIERVDHLYQCCVTLRIRRKGLRRSVEVKQFCTTAGAVNWSNRPLRIRA